MNTDLGFVGVNNRKRRDGGSEGANHTRSSIPVRLQAMKQRPGGPYPTNPSEVPPIRSNPVNAVYDRPPPPLSHLSAAEARANMARLNPPVPPPKLEEAPSVSSEDIYYVHAGDGDDFEYPDETKDRGYHAHDIHIVRPEDAAEQQKATKQADEIIAREMKQREDAADAKNRVLVRENRLPGVARNPHNVHFFAREPPKNCYDQTRRHGEPCSTDQFLAQIGQPIEPHKGEFLAEADHPISGMGGQKPNHPVPEKDREPVILVPAPAMNPPPRSPLPNS